MPREYGDVLYGHKRKAAHNYNLGNTDFKRVTRSKEQKNSIERGKTPDLILADNCKQNARQSSKIPLRKNDQKKARNELPLGNNTSSNPSDVPEPRTVSQPTSPVQSGRTLSPLFDVVTESAINPISGPSQAIDLSTEDDISRTRTSGIPPNHESTPVMEEMDYVEGTHLPADGKVGATATEKPHTTDSDSVAVFLEDFGINSEDPPPNVSLPKGADIDILKVLASMNHRLKALDNLKEMNSTLKGEITRVQSQVGEVSTQVNNVKSDLKRCENKWEEGSEAMLGRITKVEQEIQPFDLKWESGTIILKSRN